MFSQLPEEIFQLILALISKNDTIRLARVSRPLHTRLAPTFYTAINTTCFCVGVHRGLVHTLLLHPELARCARQLRLGHIPWCAENSHYSGHRHEHYECPESNAKLRAVVRRLCRRDWELTQWLEDLELGAHRDPWLAILLYLVPDLESLEIFWGGTGTRYSEWVLKRGLQSRAPFDQSPILPNLHTATIKVLSHEGRDFHLPRIAPFFQMPSMRTFRGNLMTDRLREYAMLPPNSSPITTLDLRQCGADTGFVDLIAPCANLQSFTYTEMTHNYHPGDYTELFFLGLHPSPMMKALASKRETVETLKISCSRRDRFRRQGVYANDWFGPLSPFDRLKHVHVDAANFDGTGESMREEDDEPLMPLIEFLPASIVSLWIADANSARDDPRPLWGLVVRELEALVRVAPDRFPGLNRIDVEARDLLRGAEKDVEAWEEVYPDYLGLLHDSVAVQTESLRAACIDRGIEFRVRDGRVEAHFEDVDDPFRLGRDDDDSDDEH
ncbi:hypothetical protein N7492_007607 [Penicillium capsulatum]|uniref:F-box domain-containing protein n=1 Tax=Penicillium capsulatum TaxID=69766 RepID=A0A9W9LLF7_9EURO|nr:hypothetical protein N7492_007607 [Penicillium capsulatum]KAJ6117442.1 hypothetical protein N7512_007167 [Penicillium capsulatum]